MTTTKPTALRVAGTTWPLVGLVVVCGACGLDNPTIADLFGPSGQGTNVRLTVTPDVITADGFSTSLVRADVINENGEPAAGRSVLLALADSAGRLADIGTLNATSGSLLRAAEAIVVTGPNGVAQAVYTAPARTDFTADNFVTIVARPVGTDASGAVYNKVKIELKSAEPRLFPVVPGNMAPVCGFIVEAPSGSTVCSGPNTCTVKNNTGVLFQTTSSDTDGFIVRYDWYWGDGSPNVTAPDSNHVFPSVGTSTSFTVTHRVTDNAGGVAACTATITVAP